MAHPEIAECKHADDHGEAGEAVALRAALKELFGSSASNDPILVLTVAGHMRSKWRMLYTEYSRTHSGWKCFVMEPSILRGGAARRVHALPREIALRNIAAWMPAARDAIRERHAAVFATFNTPVVPLAIASSSEAQDGSSTADTCSDDDDIAW